MPIYEFVCQSCGSRSSHFTRSINQTLSPTCPSCGSKDLTRLISRVAYHKSTKTIHEESGDPMANPDAEYFKDPRNIGRWAEKKFEQMGVEMPGEVQTMIKAAREGEMPAPVKDV